MATLAELKASSPAYANIPDAEFAQLVYRKHYAGRMSFADFSAKVGGGAPADFSGVTSRAESFPTPGPEALLSAESAPTVAYRPGMGAIDSGAPAFDPVAAAQAVAANRKADFAGLAAPLRAAVGAGSRVAGMARGVQQLGAMGLDALSPRSGTVEDLVAGADPSRYAQAQQDEAQARQFDQFMEGDTAASVGKIGADMALMAAPAARLGQGAGLARYGGQALAGAAYGAAQPIVNGESRALNTGIGAGLGIAGQGASDLIAASGRRAAQAIAPELRSLYESAKQAGIQLTPAQLSSSRPIKYLESAVRSIPFNGLGAKAAAQKAQFNRAVSRTIGEDAEAVTPEVYQAAKKRIGGEFNELSKRNALPIKDSVLDGLVSVQREAAGLGDDATEKAVNHAISRIMDQTKDGVLPGRAYQSLDSWLGKSMSFGGEKAAYLGRVRDTLREAMDDAIKPADQAAWRTARQQWRDLKTIRDLVNKGDVGEGISPQGLLARVTANNAGKESMASGSRGSLGELARIGQRIKEPQSSGTAERLGLLGTGAGALANLPATVGLLASGNIAGRVLNSGLLADYLMSAGRGQRRQALAPYLRGSGAPLFPLLAPDNELDNSR